MEPLGIAIIGGGLFVKEQHIPAVLKCDQLALKAIFSRSLKSAQDSASTLPTSHPALELYSEDSANSYSSLLQRPDIKAVIIALPIVVQPQFIEAALAAGKHVLAEKPIAKDISTAQQLLTYSQSDAIRATGATLSIAENIRFVDKFLYAREKAATFGKVTHFAVRVMFLMSPDSKWVNTAWRKTPEYQGGFLLDGGVHFAAVTRLLLGATGAKESLPATVVARTDLKHEYLAPVDSIAAVVTTRSGASGTYQHAVSSTALSAFEFDVGYEHGAVRVVQDTVTIVPKEGEKVAEEFGMAKGVEEEVAAWVEGMRQGKMHELLRPEEALKDLEFLEKMFVSAEKEGAVQRYELQ